MAKYHEIANDLEQQIKSGQLRPGDDLGSEVELVAKYSAARNTVRTAIRTLLNRGLVETSQGRRTRVARKISLSVTTLSKDPETGRAGGEEAPYIQVLDAEFEAGDPERLAVQLPELQVATQAAKSEIASALDVAPGTFIIARRQELQVNNRTRAVRISHYPYSLVEAGAHKISLPRDVPEGIIQYLRETVGVDEVGYQDTALWRAAEREEITLFDLPSDGRVGVLETSRVGFTREGTPIRVTVTTYRADSHVLINNVGHVPQARIQKPYVPGDKQPEADPFPAE